MLSLEVREIARYLDRVHTGVSEWLGLGSHHGSSHYQITV